MQIVGSQKRLLCLDCNGGGGGALLSCIQLVQMITLQNDRNRWKAVTRGSRAGVVEALLNQHFCEWSLVSLCSGGITGGVKSAASWGLSPEILLSLVQVSGLSMRFLKVPQMI